MVRVITEPSVYLIGQTEVNREHVAAFIDDDLSIEIEGQSYSDDTAMVADGDLLPEVAGRLCYMSYGKGRKTNEEYITNIKQHAHGSVLEHSTATLLLTGVSRTLTHELVRHRAGFGFSQLSQRYVEPDQLAFVVPPFIEGAGEAVYRSWRDGCERSEKDYKRILSLLRQSSESEDKLMLKKRACEAARSVLPGCTETKIVVTGNLRAWRNLLEQRGSYYADVEITRLSACILDVLGPVAPAVFADMEHVPLLDGVTGLSRSTIDSKYRKV